MALEVLPPKVAKVVRAVRLTPGAADLLDELAEVHNSNHAYIVEGLINAFGPAALEEARKIAATQPKQKKKPAGSDEKVPARKRTAKKSTVKKGGTG